MALSKITYDTKVALNPQPDIANENKVTDADMNEIKSVVNNGIDQVDANTTNIGNITGTILWTNPDPSSTFGEQNITLSSSDYDVLEFVSQQSTSDTRGSGTLRIIKGKSGRAFIIFSGALVYRNFNRNSDTSYTISAIQNGGDNGMLIPVYVIGYKTGLFS